MIMYLGNYDEEREYNIFQKIRGTEYTRRWRRGGKFPSKSGSFLSG
jgi:hypothetical protein